MVLAKRGKIGKLTRARRLLSIRCAGGGAVAGAGELWGWETDQPKYHHGCNVGWHIRGLHRV